VARIFLLRHAQSIANEKGFLAGRAENISLSKLGIKEREDLTERLQGAKFDQILSSPIQRCLETLALFHQTPEIVDEFQEVNYGDWTGKKFSSLARNKHWRQIHSNPTGVRFPNGETLPEVQIRALNGIAENVKKNSKNVLIATHADVIKVLILHALGTHLNNIDKFHIGNSSFSVIDYDKGDFRVIKVNDDSSKISNLLLKKK
jgi:probable phosphoglycerate mutase